MRPFSVHPLLLTAILLLAASSASAATAPAEIFGDSMVLQRDKPAPVWGWAEPGEKVTVSFAGQSKSAVAGDDGKWMVVLNPLKLSTEGQTLTIAGKEKVELHDVLVGDVWLCSGQSNMGRSVERSLIPAGMKWEHPSIRYSGIGRVAKYPVDHTQGGLRIGEKQLLAPPTLKDSGELDNWELLGVDGKKWHPAVATLDGERVILTSKDVPAPTEVRYCYTTIPKGPLGEERPAAAKLRRQIGEDPGKDRAAGKPDPLVVIRDVIDELGLAGGGIDNGFAHSPDYIAEVNKQGFEGLQPREIAAFLAHPSGGVAEGATQALVEHGAAVVPLMMELVHDKHPGISSGAMGVLSEMYRSDAEEYSETIPPEYEKIVAMIEPLTRHESDRIRKSATRMMLNMKIFNEDMQQVLCEIAKLEGSRIDHCVRYGVKDPAFRTRLAMELINTANRAKSQVPTHYKPINWVVSAHIDECEPYLQTAVDTLRNPSVLMLYGFFSQGPPNQSMRMLSHYADHPLVFENLPDILRYSIRRREEFGHYWWPVYEYPHRIVVQIGPSARPVVEPFLKEEVTLYKQILAGEVENPVWWVEPSEKQAGMLEHLAIFADEMRTTCRLSEALATEKPTKKDLEVMGQVYLADRRFGEWERQQMRDFWTDLGPSVSLALRKAIEKKPGSPVETLEEEIAAIEAELAKQPHRHVVSRLETQLAGLTRHQDRYDELAQQADLLEALAAKTPTPDDVRTLCQFYVKRPWGSQHPHTRSESSYMRQFDAKQMQRIRDTLQRWGGEALPTLRAFLADDKKTVAALVKQLDEDYAYWETQRARVRGLPMARTAREKEDVQDIRLELAQLADLIEAASTKQFSRQQAARLLEVCTQRSWPTQNQLVLEILPGAPFDVSRLVADHIAKQQAALPAIQEEIDTAMPKTTSTGTRWHYERAVALRKSICQGIALLKERSFVE